MRITQRHLNNFLLNSNGIYLGFPGGSVANNPPANTGEAGSIPGLRRSLGEGNGNPLQYSYLGKFMNRGAWWDTAHGVAK